MNRELGIFFVTTKYQCYEISINGFRVVPELVSTLGEAHTLMMLHVSHAKQQRFTKFLIQTLDTNVFMIALSLLKEIGNSIFIKTGVKNKVRVIELSHVKEVIHERFVLDEVTIDDFLSALLVVYAYTGCETVSALSGQGHYVRRLPENSVIELLSMIKFHKNAIC